MLSTLKLTAFVTSGVVMTNAASLNHVPVVPGLAEPWGCCYNVGFGDGMEECCQSPTQGGDVYLSECHLERRMGGATWFVEFETCEWMEKHVWCGADCTNYPLFKIVKPNEASSSLNLERRDSRSRDRYGMLNLERRDSVGRGRGVGMLNLRVLKPKASPSMSLAAASSDPMGCCFNVYFTGLMRQCCESPTQGGDVLKSKCQLRSWPAPDGPGGATWFVENETCAWMEQNLWNKGLKTSEWNVKLDRPEATLVAASNHNYWGCCFNVGFGDGMKECCQEPTQGGDVQLSSCNLQNRMGGATWFVEFQTCQWLEDNIWSKGYATTTANVMLVQPQSPSVVAAVSPAKNDFRPLDPTLAERVHGGVVRGLAPTWGCCFNVGFGAGMKECCQEPTQGGDIELSSCNLQNRMGGATWFVEFQTCQWLKDNIWSKGYATTSADVMLVQPESPPSLVAAIWDPEGIHGQVNGLAPTWGCCFDVGFGSRMKECCQKPAQGGGDILMSSCNLQNRIGGATWFVEFQTCQWLRDNIWSKGFATTTANVMLVKPDSSSMVAPIIPAICPGCPDNSVITAAVHNPQGCCFNVGFGDEMRECCQEPTQGGDVRLLDCKLQQRMGGATWFVEGQTCQWMRENIWSKGFLTTSSNVRLDMPNSPSMVAVVPSPAVTPVMAVYDLQGCCFDVGFGDFMIECCQKPTQGGDVRRSSCHLEQRLGGATWFVEGQTCAWMQEYVWGKGLPTTSTNVRLDKPSF